MNAKKMISLSLLTLAFCSMAFAAEYKSPEVGFKKQVPPSKAMKTADFGDHYKVENGAAMDRQIASEDDEPSDRDPSSVVAKKKMKKMEDTHVVDEAADAPKPWLYRNQEAGQRNRAFNNK